VKTVWHMKIMLHKVFVTQKGRFWGHEASSSCKSVGEFHGLLNDLHSMAMKFPEWIYCATSKGVT